MNRIEALLTAWDLIRVQGVAKNAPERVLFTIEVDGVSKKTYSARRQEENDGLSVYELALGRRLELGHDYVINSAVYGALKLDVSAAAQFPDFDELFFYEGDDLGAVYHKEATTFALWAPLASSVLLRYDEDGHRRYALMKRGEKGVWRFCLSGDRAGLFYAYVVTNSGRAATVIDPYGRSASLNAAMSVVIDPKRTLIDFFDEALPPLTSLSEAIIYECSVRDMTSHPASNVVHKGKFLGLIEKGRLSKGGHPVGYDYLTSLGITHLQLLPVLDFLNVDEADPTRSYNWGYDPLQYFTLEGSYAEDPSDPYSRIRDLKKLVREYHKAGIRIVLDVVYNHVYEAPHSIYEKIVPNYWFRLDQRKKRTALSGCGNDLASERPMVRRLIIDSVSYLFKEFHIDGLRFDLMGLIDVRTIALAIDAARKWRPDAVFYGEGWEMGAMTRDGTPLMTMSNAHLVPDVGFFNDVYRKTVKGDGGGIIIERPGFLLGDRSLIKDFEFVYAGSCIDQCRPRLFPDAARSINYLECHDGGTLMDQLAATLGDGASEHELEERLLLANKILLLSFGVPFFHMGQEFGLGKFFHTNTYNEGDEYNRFDIDLYDRRQSLVTAFRSYVRMRKEFSFLTASDPSIIDQMLAYDDADGDLLIILRPLDKPKRELKIYINPQDEILYKDLGGDHQVYITRANGYKDGTLIDNATIGPLAIAIFQKR